MESGAGSLQVCVVEGRNLVPRHPGAPLHAFVLLQIHDQQVCTLTSNNNLNPDWLAEFKFGVCSEDSSVVVSLYEARFPTGGKLRGKAIVSLREVVDVGTHVQWVSILAADGDFAGEICLVLRYTRLSPMDICSRNALEAKHMLDRVKPLKGQAGVASERNPLPLRTTPFPLSLIPSSGRKIEQASVASSHHSIPRSRSPSPAPARKKLVLLVAAAAASSVAAALAFRRCRRLSRRCAEDDEEWMLNIST
ncbi:uncharacterized protein [Physcomitrium patens]|uniref:C2 domain-containing protein n=2 Tax=Physcomitrium patens TaxID=3218 RepID=A0A2K1JCA9_PHYPA|nr:uncharacterized protein LOC112292251 [Physcomitrium patens]PNR39148.1 hypothetical protein PHYPA_019426 [Physcomitrium patens]|eukprot:XP_024396320.1 uncharacterized protein LOC112292251 [Physcomitrella patens]